MGKEVEHMRSVNLKAPESTDIREFLSSLKGYKVVDRPDDFYQGDNELVLAPEEDVSRKIRLILNEEEGTALSANVAIQDTIPGPIPISEDQAMILLKVVQSQGGGGTPNLADSDKEDS